ncbi:two-component system sensor kinase and response regulator [Thermotomaculum hydrothermale]|uniref:histidine kinase n=1 Tax=Thermotomaculum hydrothermale TaxID=981385 RepID=A0A7R6PZV6_9BACT|nr:ATP-binding protein [Thermotomaculum hydrothermale]BBB32893.1 two-component system sensor kinase and response regulator [Thermotomaculum hydrothermale]
MRKLKSIIPHLIAIGIFSFSLVFYSLYILHYYDNKIIKDFNRLSSLNKEIEFLNKIKIILFIHKDNRQLPEILIQLPKELKKTDPGYKEIAQLISEINKQILSTNNKNTSLIKNLISTKLNHLFSLLKTRKNRTKKEITCYYKKRNKTIYFIVFITLLLVIAYDLYVIGLTKTNEELLKTKIEESKQAAIEKENFLATMSHEIRTPLNGILGIINLLEMSKDIKNNPLLNEQVGQLKNVSNNLLLLINDILTFSKIKSKKIQIIEEEFNIELAIKELIAMLIPNAMRNKVEIFFPVSHDIPFTIIGDQIKVKQIVLNLLTNAVKFIKDGYVEIKVEKKRETEKEIYLIITVEDTGCGMEESALKRIFEPFVQNTTTQTRTKQGTGLGLAIVKNLVELLNGQIYVETKLNKGTTFKILLPFKKSSKDFSISKDYISQITIFAYIPNKKLIKPYTDIFSNLKLKKYYISSDFNELKSKIPEKRSKKTIILFDIDYLDINDELINKINELIINKNTKLLLHGLPIKQDFKNIIKQKLQELKESKGIESIVEFVPKPLTRSLILNILIKLGNITIKDWIEEKKAKKPLAKNIKDLLKGKKILVVDDNTLNRSIILKLLESINVKAIEATSGIEALLKVDNEKPDLIILDYHMPLMDGIECARELRVTYSKEELPIILLTADIFKKKTEEDKTLFNSILEKPIDFDNLLSNLLDVLYHNGNKENKFQKNEAKKENTNKREFNSLKSIYPDENSVKEALKIVREDLPGDFALLKEKILEKDYKGAKDSAHKIKGTLKYLEERELIDLFQKIEDLCKKNSDIELIKNTVEIAEKKLNDFLNYLDNYLQI